MSQNDENRKPQTAELDDTAIPHITIKITELPLEKSSILQYRRLPCPPPKNKTFLLSLTFFFKLEKFLAFCHYGDDYNYDYDDDDNGVYIYLIIIIITIVIIIIIRPQRKWCLHGMSPSPTRHHRH